MSIYSKGPHFRRADILTIVRSAEYGLYCVWFGEFYGYLVCATGSDEAGALVLEHHMNGGDWDDFTSKNTARRACTESLKAYPPKLADSEERDCWFLDDEQWDCALTLKGSGVVASCCFGSWWFHRKSVWGAA